MIYSCLSENVDACIQRAGDNRASSQLCAIPIASSLIGLGSIKTIAIIAYVERSDQFAF